MRTPDLGTSVCVRGFSGELYYRRIISAKHLYTQIIYSILFIIILQYNYTDNTRTHICGANHCILSQE